jgi:hypothetical protein
VRWWGRRHVVTAIVATALAALILAGGVIVGSRLTSRSSPSRPSTTSLPDAGRLKSGFQELKTTLHGNVGIAVAPVGQPQRPVLLGDWTSGPAWSTMKVPLAIAAMRAEDPPTVDGAIRAAITESDNAAADTLWRSLGDPQVAAAKVDAVLQETGDPTKVQSQRIRPEFSAFGQTDWSLADQTRFLAAATCDNRNKPILDLMADIEGAQRWGLGIVADSRFKGGWGPSDAGAYLVRQIGVLPADAGEVAVAIAVAPKSGAFGDGTADLTRIAEWLSEHAADLPAGRCAS